MSEHPAPGGFPLFASGHAAPIATDSSDASVVVHAADDLAGDVEAVTGVRPERVGGDRTRLAKRVVLVGTLGLSGPIDELVRRGRLDVRPLRGAWESFIIATVRRPLPGIDRALVVVGSDRRGTAFGVYELSEAIGVSPWCWWADVPAQKHAALWLPPGARRFGPPSVKFRGIFINDEDWGLHPWAARTFEPASGGIGPKTYERVFELLLRLKANTLWPAMHKVSRPFNADPENARLADRYAIVMGSSHAEPMLRDNVGEWKDAPEKFNYAVNREGVRTYWQRRVASNAKFESLWTLGMRGIHDSGVMGATTIPAKVALLTQVLSDQRELLRKYVNPDLAHVPQMFMPYKEVLDIYRGGLHVPDDVTIVWPDDNFGYVRQFPDDAERARSGGSGIYYHLSYLGAPLSYIWLSTTPPALVMEEMTRAWDAGVRRVWIANVGDIKPAENDISLFMEMAWNIDRWRGKSQRAFLDDWSERSFGPTVGKTVGAILDRYYAVNFERRPEHLQWWLPGQQPRYSTLSQGEIAARLGRFGTLESELDQVRSKVAPEQADAFFELVDYPVRASAAANVRYFAAERYARTIDGNPAEARAAAAVAANADRLVKALTRRFNEDVAGGKWRYIIAEEPADNQWPQFRISPIAIPAPGLRAAEGSLSIAPIAAACASTTVPPAPARGWTLWQGLGRSGGTVVAESAGAQLELEAEVPKGCTAALALLPTFPTVGEHGFRIQISIDGGAPFRVDLPRQAEKGNWAQEVLDNRILVPLNDLVAAGAHRISVSTDEPGLAIDGVLISPQRSMPVGH